MSDRPRDRSPKRGDSTAEDNPNTDNPKVPKQLTAEELKQQFLNDDHTSLNLYAQPEVQNEEYYEEEEVHQGGEEVDQDEMQRRMDEGMAEMDRLFEQNEPVTNPAVNSVKFHNVDNVVPGPGPLISKSLPPIPLDDPVTNPWTRVAYSKKYYDILEKRKTLPCTAAKEEFVKLVAKNQCIVLVGETGSGKTTQCPQFLLPFVYNLGGSSGVSQQQNKCIACTQPRRVAAMSVATRVAEEMDVELGKECGYSVRFDDKTDNKRTRLKYMTDGMLLREAMTEPTLSRYSVIMLDEAHERTLSTDVLFGLLKRIMATRTKQLQPDNELKVVVMSATLDAQRMQSYFNNAPLISVPGRTFPVEIFYTPQAEADYLKASIRTVLMIHQEEPEGSGDILLFLTGEEEIENACRLITNSSKQLLMSHGELKAIPLYSSLPPHLQQKVFEPPPEPRIPGGKKGRKVVVSTNVAETSLTVEGIVYVIDPGVSKQKLFNPRLKYESLLVAPISQASAKQRSGRAGRTRPGKCFRLFTESSFKQLDPQTFPEILRANLSNTVLTLLKLGINDLIHFDFLDPPSPESLMHALNHLRNLQALDKFMQLTEIGRLLAEFPLDPNPSKMLLAAATKYSCSAECLAIVAMLSVPQVFVRGKVKEKQEAEKMKDMFNHIDGDHFQMLNVFQFYERVKRDGPNGEYASVNDHSTSGFSDTGSTTATNLSTGQGSRAVPALWDMEPWSKKHFLSLRALTSAESVRNQLQAILQKLNLPVVSIGQKHPDWNSNIRKAVIGGCFQNVGRLAEDGEFKDKYHNIRDDTYADIFPSSCLGGKSGYKPKWVIFNETVHTTKNYIQCVTGIKPEWLIQGEPEYFGSNLVKLPRSKGQLELQEIGSLIERGEFNEITGKPIKVHGFSDGPGSDETNTTTVPNPQPSTPSTAQMAAAEAAMMDQAQAMAQQQQQQQMPMAMAAQVNIMANNYMAANTMQQQVQQQQMAAEMQQMANMQALQQQQMMMQQMMQQQNNMGRMNMNQQNNNNNMNHIGGQ